MRKFEIYRTKNGQYSFRLKLSNGQIVLASEMYTTKQSCINGIQSVKINSQLDKRFKREASKNGSYYFNLIASNNEVIGTSEMYSSKSGLENGIYAVKEYASGADVLDLT